MEYQDHLEHKRFYFLLERCQKPLYVAIRGYGTKRYVFNLPPEFLKPHEKEAMIQFRKSLSPVVGIQEIPVRKPAVPYDLTKIQKAVPRDSYFGEFSPAHLDAAAELAKILIDQGTLDDFFNACALCRDAVNSYMWVYAFFRAAGSRQDMHGFRYPGIHEIIPEMFYEGKSISMARDQFKFPEQDRAVIVIDKSCTGMDTDPNHKVAYFAEDVAANSHHWHWHLVYAANAPRGQMDKRGEFFYYMLARYDTERLANGLNRTVPFDIHWDVIPEGYFPKLTLQNSAFNYPGRQPYTRLRDLDRTMDPGTSWVGRLPVRTLRLWCDRIFEAIDAGFVVSDGGGRVDVRTDNGISVISSVWESNNDSPNLNYYGVMHNQGHTIISLLHDPEYKYRETPGVMYFTGTSMRDPVFFRWHRFLDFISKRQKDYLKPYPLSNLVFPGITVHEIHMIRKEPSKVAFPNLNTVNNMVTHWEQHDVDMFRGLDFGRSTSDNLGAVWVRTTHLQHVPFLYRIRVTNDTFADTEATVRIFMAPKFNENGDRFPFFEQRIYFFEMDKFVVTLRPGENIISQKSEDSTLTIPWAQTFSDLERDTTAPPTRAEAMCYCGWPAHLLLPRGKPEGMLFDLVVMLTNTRIDQVPSSKTRLGSLNAKGGCRESISYCGLIDDKNPDSRPMGYPFDRPAVPNETGEIDTFLEDFVAPIPNMSAQEIRIVHVDKTIVAENGAPKDSREIHCIP